MAPETYKIPPDHVVFDRIAEIQGNQLNIDSCRSVKRQMTSGIEF